MLKRLYDWTLGLAGRETAEVWLAIIAFVESSVFLIPADVLFIPMGLARPGNPGLRAGPAPKTQSPGPVRWASGPGPARPSARTFLYKNQTARGLWYKMINLTPINHILVHAQIK